MGYYFFAVLLVWGMHSVMKAKILYENQRYNYIAKIETGEFSELYVNVDIDSDNVWLEALWAMFF